MSRLCLLCVLLLVAPDCVAEPKEEPYLPLRLGFGWELKDDRGAVQTVIREKEKIAGKEYYRADWTDMRSERTYQSEYWLEKKDGIYVAGRKVLGRTLMHETPYRILTSEPKVGDKWQAELKNQAYSDTLEFHVEKKESLTTTTTTTTTTTAAGKIEALKVTMQGRSVRIERWYARGRGLVQEISYGRTKNNEFKLVNKKVLSKTVGGSPTKNEKG